MKLLFVPMQYKIRIKLCQNYEFNSIATITNKSYIYYFVLCRNATKDTCVF